MNKKANEKGFTLIELLVVVAIIAILALIVLLALNPVEMARRSRDSRRMSDLGTVRRAIDLALADDEALTAVGPVAINTSTDVTNFDGGGLDISKYLSVVPQDPINDGSADSIQVVLSTCAAGTTTKGAMIYEYWSDGNV
ncbi:MAG: prepilin-type N-terminal cleavage/methylation domain-containing protein, partial [Candidatus Woesebacteria bacterium]